MIKNIVIELNKLGYTIIQQNHNCIEFKYNIWNLGSRTESFKKIDRGIFDIIPETKTIVFTYYLSPLFEILATCIAAFLGFTQDYHIYFFIIFIAVMFVIRLISVKIVANRIMKDILNLESL